MIKLYYQQKQRQEFDSEDDVIIWMIDNQLARRNISDFNRTLLAIVQGEIFSKRARENIVTAAKIGASITNRSVQISAQSGFQEKPITKPVITPIKTRDELAKLANVSHDTIAKVKKIEAAATPETKAKLSRSEMSINEAYKEIRAVEKKEEVRAIQQKEAEILSAHFLPFSWVNR